MTATHTYTVPAGLPPRLTISLWDYSWYARAGVNEPYADLNGCFADAVARGFNTVRVCAMPFLLFGEHDLPDRQRLRVAGLGNGYGQGSRWCNGTASSAFDPLERLGRLLDAAREHDCFVILSSWEYQQSPAFSATRDWYDALVAVPVEDRLRQLSRSFSRMLDWLRETGRFDRVAYVELHNELEYSRIGAGPGLPATCDLAQSAVEAAITSLRQDHPDVLVTVSYVEAHADRTSELARNAQVMHTHSYVQGVVHAFRQEMIAPETMSDSADIAEFMNLVLRDFPNAALRKVLLPGAPPLAEHVPSDGWKLEASLMPQFLIYCFDFIDPLLADRWLYEHHHEHRDATRAGISAGFEATASRASALGVPAVVGEGYLWTALRGGFEDGPIGKGVSEFAIQEAIRLGLWGVILSTSCAPNMPGWDDIPWQRKWNQAFLES